MPMPPTTAPRIWLLASFGLRMRPAATALTTRVTRMTPSCSSTLTSANTAECAKCEYLLRSFGSALAAFSIRSALPARIASATETSRVFLLVPDLAFGEHYVVELRTGERRSRRLLRQAEQLLLDRATGCVDGTADRRDGERSAFDRRCRQRGIAELRRDILDRDSEHLGGELSHPRIGPGTDVGGRACDLDAAIGGQRRLGARRHLHRFPEAGRHAPADQFVAIAHRTRLRIATGPAEFFRALSIAFAQLFAAIASILDLVLVRVVDQPQFERIDVRRIGELIHRAFDGIGAFRSARCTHVAGGILIELDEPLTELAVCAFVEQARPVDQIPLEILELRGHAHGLVAKRGEASVLIGCKCHFVHVRGSIAEREHLLAGQRP